MIEKVKEINSIEIIVTRWFKPIPIILWWIWVLSGIKGFLWLRIRRIKTLTTSKQGTNSGANAITNGLTHSMVVVSQVHNFKLKKQSNNFLS